MKNRIVCCTAALLLAAGGLGALPAGTLNTAIMASAYEKGYFDYNDKYVKNKDGFTYIIWGKGYAGKWFGTDYYFLDEEDMDGAVQIIDYDIKGDTLEFPDEIDGHPVRIIEFSNLRKSKVKKVIMPRPLLAFFDSEYEEYLGDGFYDYGDLLRLPEAILDVSSVEYVGFNGNKSDSEYTAEDGVLFHDSNKYGKELCCVPPSRTDYTIPTDVDSIADRAFFGNKMTAVTVPENITHIGDEAFSECPNLKTADIKASVKEIGSYCFFWDKKLETVSLPDTIEIMSEDLFTNCCSLKSIVIPPKVKIIDSWCFEECSSLTSIYIPDSVTTIRESAFRNCSSLNKVKMSRNVEIILESAFYDCEKLDSIILPRSINVIDEHALGYKYDADRDAVDENFTLYCYPGVGEKYAKKNKINYKLINGDLSKSRIKLTDGNSYVYEGKAVRPRVKVTLNSKTLKNKTDYKLFYKNNTEPGKAKVVVKGVGAFSGRGVKTFYIKPAAARITKLTSPRKKAVKLTWKRDKLADGYQIFVSYSKNFKRKAKTVTIKKNATVAKTVTGLRSGKKCYMKIRAYKTVDGRKLYGKCSKTLSIKCK